MGDFGADTLRDSIEAGWALSGRVAKTVSAGVEHIVNFFAHPQHPSHEWPKAVEVRKINPDENENITTHPKYEDVEDIYEVTCRYRIGGTDETLFDQAENDIEDMQEEVVRIIKTVYDPLAGTGVYFKTIRHWTNEDSNLTAAKPELKRTLRLALIKIKSDNTGVYEGFAGLVIFDLSASSNMDTAPSGDYTYTEAYDVNHGEGSTTISVMTRNSSSGTGKPAKFRGKFDGQYSFVTYGQQADLDNTPNDAVKLDNIYKAQANGELITAGINEKLLNRASNTRDFFTKIMVVNIRRQWTDESLYKYTITGDVTEPSTVAA